MIGWLFDPSALMSTIIHGNETQLFTHKIPPSKLTVHRVYVVETAHNSERDDFFLKRTNFFKVKTAMLLGSGKIMRC